MAMTVFSLFNDLIYDLFSSCSVVNAEAFSIKPWADGKNRLNTQSRHLLSLAAFVAYLGFLNVLVAHSHPVMLVFCHLLINRDIGLWLEESFPRTESSVTLQEERYGQGILCFWNLLLFVCFVCLFCVCVCVCCLSNFHQSKKCQTKKG